MRNAANGAGAEPSAEEAAELRRQLEEALATVAAGAEVSEGTADEAELGHRLWARCEALTSGLSGEQAVFFFP